MGGSQGLTDKYCCCYSWIFVWVYICTTILVTFDKFDLNPILINIDKLKLYRYPKYVTHPSPTFVPIVLVNLI